MSPRPIGEQIQRRRKRRGWTQAELAKRAGISRIYLQKIEIGERRSPSRSVLDRIAKELGVFVRLTLTRRP